MFHQTMDLRIQAVRVRTWINTVEGNQTCQDKTPEKNNAQECVLYQEKKGIRQF